MNIKIDGLTLTQYKDSDMLDELHIAIESIEPMSYTRFDELATLDTNELDDYFGSEALIWDAVKTSYKVAKNTAKAGKATYRAANRQVDNLKRKWAQYKPILIKMIKGLGNSLSMLWAKFAKYDKQYLELGKKIRDIIDYKINQITNFPAVTLIYHAFNAKLMKGYIELISDYEQFFNVIKAHKELFDGDLCMEAVEFTQLVKKKDKATIKRRLASMSTGMERLNAYGELTIPAVIARTSFFRELFNGVDRELARARSNNSMKLADYVKASILRDEIKREYSATPASKNDFKRDMIDNNGYLTLMATILNNGVLADALKKGGASIKKDTDEMIRRLEEAAKTAEQEARSEEAVGANPNDNSISSINPMADNNQNSSSGNNVQNMEEDVEKKGPTFGGDEQLNEELQQNTADDITSLTDQYIRLYTALLNKIGTAYTAIVRGVLMASYELIKETGVIVQVIESAVGDTGGDKLK